MEPAKARLNNSGKTTRSHSIIKNIGQIQNFQRIIGDLKKLEPQPEVQFHILKRCRPTKRKVVC